MADEESHGGSAGRVLALVTALITLVGAAITAGIIHTNGPGQGGQVLDVVTTSSRSSTPAPSPSPSRSASPSPTRSPSSTRSTTSASRSWAAAANAVCVRAQRLLDANGRPLLGTDPWKAAGYMAQVIAAMDTGLRQVDVPADVRPRIQLMTTNWDHAAEVLGRAAAEAGYGYETTARDELRGYDDPNGRGNQIAEDLGLATCAAVGLPLNLG